MAGWRDQGYVPDSEDEEEHSLTRPPPPHTATEHHLQGQPKDDGEPYLDDLATQQKASQSLDSSALEPGSISLGNIASPTANKLQAELHRGLLACKDVLTTTTPGLGAYLEEDDSSLSSLSSSPPPPPSPVFCRSVQHPLTRPPSSPLQQPRRGEQPSPSTLSSSPPQLPIAPDAASEAAPLLRTTLAGRSLRPRTQLQLNPYSLEYARYQQECSRRGIVPVRLANFAEERAKAKDKDSTQLSDPFLGSDLISSPVRSPSFTTLTPSDGIYGAPLAAGDDNDDGDGDDELPELSEILSRPLNGLRRKHRRPPRQHNEMAELAKEDDTPVFKLYKLPWQLTGNVKDSRPARQASSFDGPMLPSPSASVTSEHVAVHGDDELPPVHITPAQLPTPVLSSDRQSAKRKVVELSSSLQEEDEELSHGHESQASESEQGDADGLFHIRRKIKGVLPASWLKLDARQQGQKTTTHSRVSHDNPAPPLKGVAKHISPTVPRDSPRASAHKPIIFSSDVEDSSASENEHSSPSSRRPAQPVLDANVGIGVWESESEMDDVRVEDEIDRMLPSNRRPNERRRSNKALRRIVDSRSTHRIPNPPRKQSTLTRPQSTTRRVAARPTVKRPKTVHRARQLTILDAPGFALNGVRSPPRYLRIAARKRPSRLAPLAQQVTRKYVQLPDLGDGVNANLGPEESTPRHPLESGGDMDVIVQHEQSEKSHSATEVVDALYNLKQSTTAIVTRLRAGALARSQPRQIAPGTARPHAGGRYTALQRPPLDLRHPYRAPSRVSEWLEHVHISQQPPLQNAEKVVVLQPFQRTPNTDIHPPMNSESRGARPMTGLQRSRRRKQPPRGSLTKHLDTGSDLPPMSPALDRPDLIQTRAARVNNEHDTDLVAWVLDHLDLDHATAARPEMYSPTRSALPLEIDLDDMMSTLFSRAQLPDTFLKLQSLTEIQGLTGTPQTLPDKMSAFLHWLPHAISSPQTKEGIEDKVAAFIASAFTGPSSQLAATLLILSVICPLCRPSAEALHWPDLSHRDSFDGWRVLQPTLSLFLNSYTASNSHGQGLGRRLGLLTVNFCYLAVRRWQWSSSEAIAKFWFKQYAQNDMIELFVVPNLHRVTERSKRAGLSLATDANDTDYDIFLKLVAALLESRIQLITFCGDDVGKAVGRIQSLVFSISPNNSRKLSEDQNLHLEDLVSMANIYALYEHLNEFAPSGCQPRFSLVEKLVDFPNCHWSVSQFALRTWSRFANNAINRTDLTMLKALGSWISRTIEQMALKLPPTSSGRVEPRLTGAEYALQRNATQTGLHISELLSAWKAALIRCATDDECTALLNGGRIERILDFCKDRRLVNNSDVAVRVCELVEKYLDRANLDPSNMIRGALHKHFRGIMIATLSSEDDISTACLRAVSSLWYRFARVTVRNKQKSWDDYLSLPSSWSFGLLAASELSRRCKVYFLRLIVEDDTMHFELDREPFYSAWMEGLVQPLSNVCFEHELSKSIILHETDEMPFQDLRNMLRGANGQVQLDVTEFKQNRLEIVKHVIRNVFLLQFEEEDSQDFLGKPLNVDQGRRLLKLMTDTIKACWRTLPVSDRPLYTEFAQAVVTQLRIYKYDGFHIDPWFTDPQQPEFPKEVPFASQFLLPVNQNGPILPDERLVRIFFAGNLQAAGTGEEHSWSTDVVRALSATAATSVIDSGGRLAVNAELQFAFIRQVMSVLVCNVFKGPSQALFARPILSALLQIVRSWHFRLDINSDGILCQMLFTASNLLASILETVALAGPQLAGFVGQGGEIGNLITALVDLGSACVRRMTMLVPMVEENEENVEVVEAGYACANVLYERLLLSIRRRCQDGITESGNEASDLCKTPVSVKTQAMLDESLRGRTGQPWRMEHPLTKSWDEWLKGGPDDDAAAKDQFSHTAALKKLEDALADADMLFVARDDSIWEMGDQAVALL